MRLTSLGRGPRAEAGGIGDPVVAGVCEQNGVREEVVQGSVDVRGIARVEAVGGPAETDDEGLVVDDSSVIRKVARTLLNSIGYQVVEAETGVM